MDFLITWDEMYVQICDEFIWCLILCSLIWHMLCDFADHRFAVVCDGVQAE